MVNFALIDMPAEQIKGFGSNSSVIELGAPSGAVLFNLAAFGAGTSSVVDYISSGQRGIYAWFRGFDISDEPDDLYDSLMDAIVAPKFQRRTGVLAPYYEVALSSKGAMPDGKRKSLEAALKRQDVVEMFNAALKWSILFQAPLYIGKSIDLKARIGQHLKSKSPLRSRLSEASINLDKCQLLLLPIGSDAGLAQEDQDVQGEGEVGDVDEMQEHQDELIFEEVFSRIFNPSFTVRIG